jgi:hypothetical protein
MNMDRQSKEPVANIDEDELKVFVRSSPEELDAGELHLVGGGGRSVLVPIG